MGGGVGGAAGRKGGAALMRHLWCPVPLKRGTGRGWITAERKECQRGLWKDALQSEHLVRLEGLTKWDKGSVSASDCMWACALFYYTKLFLDMQSESLQIHMGFGLWLEAETEQYGYSQFTTVPTENNCACRREVSTPQHSSTQGDKSPPSPHSETFHTEKIMEKEKLKRL